MTATVIEVALEPAEASQLESLADQLRTLLHDEDGTTHPTDPGIGRLLPDAYRHDPDAAAQFRRLTAPDLLERRDTDAQTVLSTLHDATRDAGSRHRHHGTVTVHLTPAQGESWLRTLTALRLVLAERLGVRREEDGDRDDPRFAVYEWLAYRLELLVQALDAAGV